MATGNKKSGILYVTMQPKEGLPIAQFHDWYNNEHGPGRLRLPFVENGFRYQAADLKGGAGSAEQPEWMATYDISDMDFLTQDIYTRLRKAPVQSQRERDTMKQISIDRKFYDLEQEWVGEHFAKLEDVQQEGKCNVKITVLMQLKPGEENEEGFLQWYREEHIGLVSKTPGWRRTRLFVTSYLDIADGRPKQFMAQTDFAPENGIAGPVLKEAASTEWTQKVRATIQSRVVRNYNLYYTFGPAPRDLRVLTSADTLNAQSTDGLTKTVTASSDSGKGFVESYVTMSDGALLPYRLEGSTDLHAPLLILVNSVLVTYSIWDEFVQAFLNRTKNGYRVLRYNARGRSKLPSSSRPVTVDVLAEDVVAIMDALRAKTASVVGVSLGGATALNAALRSPARVSAFIACDTNSVAPPGNPKAWDERVAVAEKEGAVSSDSQEAIVGAQLANMTTNRWFTKENLANSELAPKLSAVNEIVRNNSLDGFKTGVKALYQYDFRAEMAAFKGKGAFLVGSEDGVLPKTMQEMAKSLGQGVRLKIIEEAGHLPMVERPQEVAAFVAEFLQ